MNWQQRLAYIRAVAGITHGSRAFGGPVQACLSLTNRCNIKCIHCYYYSPYLKSPTRIPLRRARLTGVELPGYEELKRLQKLEADTDQTNALIDKLIEMGTQRFQIGSGGEVFLYKNALEIMGRVKHAGCCCEVETNGTLLDQTTMDDLIDMGLDNLRITVMAGTREMYVRTHPGIKNTAFDDLKENLIYMAEKKNSLRVKRPEVSLFYVVVSENYEGLFEFAEFADSVRADRIQYRPFDDVDDPGLAKLIPAAEQASYVRKQLIQIKPYLESQGIKHNISNFLEAFGRKLNTTALYRVIPCFYGWLSVRIRADGTVYPCCRCYNALGNVYETEFEEIWHGEAYRRLRKEAVTINRRRTPVRGCICDSCVNYTANLRVYRTLHPLTGRSNRVEHICATFSKEQ